MITQLSCSYDSDAGTASFAACHPVPSLHSQHHKNDESEHQALLHIHIRLHRCDLDSAFTTPVHPKASLAARVSARVHRHSYAIDTGSVANSMSRLDSRAIAS